MSSPSLLISWIGSTDLRAPSEAASVGLGPVAQAIEGGDFDEAILLTDFPKSKVQPYLRWLRRHSRCRVTVEKCVLTSPTDFGEIYANAVRVVSDELRSRGSEVNLTFHLSPGTPAMAAIWILLAKTRFAAELIESSREHGVRPVSVPFDISADFLPDLLRRPDAELLRLGEGLAPEAPEFADIVHNSRVMKRVILLARRVAVRSVPVVVEGETGTGKELLARAIHQASPRRSHHFIAVNCGAIPPELVESELFGHVKGAFTGATMNRKGHFVQADGGTLFLDEIGDLPKQAQVKLLRVLQEGEILPVGASRARRVDVRVIAATNRSLLGEVAEGRFRADLFHRLAVAILELPPLRERREDLVALIDHFVREINREGRGQPGFKEKKVSVGARKVLLQHTWPGNIRELQNTLTRSIIWTPGAILSSADIQDALLPTRPAPQQGILGRPLGEGLDLPEILASVARHYLARALEEAHGNKTRAAHLLGLRSYQTLTNWMRRYGVGR